jgi:hypothetical protein
MHSKIRCLCRSQTAYVTRQQPWAPLSKSRRIDLPVRQNRRKKEAFRLYRKSRRANICSLSDDSCFMNAEIHRSTILSLREMLTQVGMLRGPMEPEDQGVLGNTGSLFRPIFSFIMATALPLFLCASLKTNICVSPPAPPSSLPRANTRSLDARGHSITPTIIFWSIPVVFTAPQR